MPEPERDVLTRAAELALAGIDLRYEGGPWVEVAERCCEAGWLRRVAHGEHDYFLSYFITDAGRTVLEREDGSGGTRVTPTPWHRTPR